MDNLLNTSDSNSLMPIISQQAGFWRLIVGLLQGAILYVLYLYHNDSHSFLGNPLVFKSLLFIGLFVPVVAISSIGYLSKARLFITVWVACLMAGGMGLYDAWRQVGLDDNYAPPIAIFFTGIGFYIAQTLNLAAVFEKRFLATYHTYFDVAWKFAIQLKFSSLFVGVLWLVLWLGAGLFMLVKLAFLKELLTKEWFSIPVTAVAFSCAFHLTDVRPAIVNGIRSLLLTLMSWLLLLIVLIVAGFLLSLLGTGLTPLWKTRYATTMLLGTSAALVLLINAAFQNGGIAATVPRILRYAARLACLLLMPITLIATYALFLRVQQYGWTADRVFAAASLLVASCYATGYFIAGLKKSTWLCGIAPTNIVTAFVVLSVLVALFSPVADPARIWVVNQVKRLEQGVVSATDFDFDHLRFYGARFGIEALQQLKTTTTGNELERIHLKAEAALEKTNRWSNDSTMSDKELAKQVTMYPSNAVLPDSFVQKDWSAMKRKWNIPTCLRSQDEHCDGYLIDFNNDGQQEILLIDVTRKYRNGGVVFTKKENNDWEVMGKILNLSCDELDEKLMTGQYKVVPPVIQELEIADQRFTVIPDTYDERGKQCE